MERSEMERFANRIVFLLIKDHNLMVTSVKVDATWACIVAMKGNKAIRVNANHDEAQVFIDMDGMTMLSTAPVPFNLAESVIGVLHVWT